jgi:riboflavin synthase
MFTGLIQQTGRVLSVESRGGTHRIAIDAPGLAARLHIGDSVSVNGVCLTALALTPQHRPNHFEADLAQETLRRTTLAQLAPGTAVNLELPTPAGAPLGGHVVQGHVDGVGRVSTLRAIAPHQQSTDWWLEVEVPEAMRGWIVEKGSIAIEGISLTVASWDGARIGVAIIPHTWANTNLHHRKPGDLVNLEADVLLKYASQLTMAKEQQHSAAPELTLEFLIANGY